MARDTRFTRMNETREQYFERRDGEKKLAYERSIVRKFLRRSGLPVVALKVMQPDDGDTDVDEYLSFSWFHDRYPAFPMRFVTHEIKNAKLHDFFKPLSRGNSLWVPWKTVRQEYRGVADSGMALGCVFDAPEVGTMVMHNKNDLPFVPYNKPFARLHGVSLNDEHITIETLDSLAHRMEQIWSP